MNQILENPKAESFVNEIFMSFNFWLTKDEIDQLDEISIEHETQQAIIVQKVMREALKQLRENK